MRPPRRRSPVVRTVLRVQEPQDWRGVSNGGCTGGEVRQLVNETTPLYDEDSLGNHYLKEPWHVDSHKLVQ